MVRKESILALNAKIAIAKDVIKDSLNSFNRLAIVRSGGKDSIGVLDLVAKCTEELGLKLPTVLFIDPGEHYPETFKIISKSESKYNFKTIIAKNSDALNTIKNGNIQISDLSELNRNEVNIIGFLNKEFEYSLESDVGNHILKTVQMNDAMVEYRFDALFTEVRWDENEARPTEIFMYQRKNPEHIRLQLISPFLEKDIWQYIFKYNLLTQYKIVINGSNSSIDEFSSHNGNKIDYDIILKMVNHLKIFNIDNEFILDSDKIVNEVMKKYGA